MHFAEKRKFPRVQAEFSITLKFLDDAEKALAFVKNISKGGLFLETARQLGPNDLVEIIFSLPGSKEEHRVKGQVVRLITYDNPKKENELIHGVGIRFTEISPEVTNAIASFVDNSLDGKEE